MANLILDHRFFFHILVYIALNLEKKLKLNQLLSNV
jgi:hypothetical protein